MRFLLPALALAVATPVQSQGLHKCRNEAGRLTYAGQECRLLNLLYAGEINGHINVMPAVRQNYSVFTRPRTSGPHVHLAEQVEVRKDAVKESVKR
jgi:hypothetical protein